MHNSSSITIDKITVARNFSRAAASYDEAAVLNKEVGVRLLERLDFIKLAPKRILDLGSGTGIFSQKLLQKYPESEVFSLDIAEGMLVYAKDNLYKGVSLLCADSEKLPIANQSIELIFSNCSFHWCFDINTLFAECQRVLKPGGLLLFSTYGPDTLKELRESFWKLDSENHHVNLFIDMHDVGDLLLHSGFLDPVMDMENYTLLYQTVSQLHSDLKSMGANLVLVNDKLIRRFNRNIALKKLSEAYEIFRVDADLPATFEIIYGHAFQANEPNNNLYEHPEKQIPLKIITS